MADHERNLIETETGLISEEITISKGPAFIRVYTHGSTNVLSCFGQSVTAQRPLETQLVNFTEVYKQRGANPFMGPMAGRFGEGLAQPGSEDIHGVFAGLPWTVEEISDEDAYVQLGLSASVWKQELKNYYYFAASKPEGFGEERKSLERLIKATTIRYKAGHEAIEKIKELDSALRSKRSSDNLGHLEVLVGNLVDLAYGGEADLQRRITIDFADEQTVEFLDEVSFRNVSPTDEYRDASGYHTYFDTLLSEIVMPKNFWKGSIPAHYDDNLPDVRVRELNQQQRLGRQVFIIPEGELQSASANQIIYKDPVSVGIPEVAIENWRQPGDENYYPKRAKVLKPGETSHVGVRIIVVNGPEIPRSVQEYVHNANNLITNG